MLRNQNPGKASRSSEQRFEPIPVNMLTEWRASSIIESEYVIFKG